MLTTGRKEAATFVGTPAIADHRPYRPLPRFAAAIFLVLAALISVQAAAQCSATLNLSPKNDNGIHFSLTGAGSCPNVGDDQTKVEMFISENGGAFAPAATCPSSPCTREYDQFFSCLPDGHTWTLKVSCWKAIANGCAKDTDGVVTQGFHLDHTPAITSVDMKSDLGGPGIIAGTVHYRAPAATGNNGLSVEVLGGISSPSFFASNGGSGPDYQAGFSGGPDGSGSTKLLLTVRACDKTTSTVVSAADNECPSGGDSSGSSCPSCAGRPIRLSNGNMRMTDRDPLPGGGAISLTRTFDSRGVAGFFGNGWTSLFDARIRTYQSRVLGTTFLEARTASNSEYVFQNVAGSWLQMWPQGSTGAILIPGAGTFTLREPRSTTETVFDATTGRLLLARSRLLGREAVISYSGGFPTRLTDSWGNWSWTITPDLANRINTIAVDGTSLVWTYSYDGNGNLSSVTGPSGAAWRNYTYSSQRLTSATDARGNLIESHAYSTNSGVTRSTSSVSDQDDITSIDYVLPGRDNFELITRTTSGTGATTDYYTRYIAGRPRTVQIVGNCLTCGTNDAVYAYDLPNGHLLREQDARGYITVRQFDQSDRVTSVAGPYRPSGCDPATDTTHCRQTPTSLFDVPLDPTASTLTTTYAYGDGNWPEIATLTAAASVLAPNQVRSTAVELDPVTGAVTRQITTGMTGSPAQSVQYTTTMTLYDGTAGAAFNPGGAFDLSWLSLPQPPGLRKSSDGPRTDVADVSQWVYYPINAIVPVLLRGHLAGVRNAAGNMTRFENYDVFGNAGRIVDANGVATEYTFDTTGRLLTSTLKGVAGCDTTADPLCATDLVSARTYQPALGPLTTTTMPGGGTTSYEYDSRGRVSATTRQVTASAYERIEYDYDPATGHKSAERYLGGHPGVWSVTRSEAFQYDLFGRLSEIDHPDGSRIVYHYDGANNVISVQDERHATANTNYVYDPANRLSSVTQTLSSAPSGQIVTTYGYDLHGNLTSVTDPNGNLTSYVYDDFGRMLRQASPVTGTTTYTYDAAGNLISTTDANSATTARAYDALSRVTSAVSSRSGLDTETVTYAYDEAGAGFGLGRLTTMSDPIQTTSYRYERRGLLTAAADSDFTTTTFAYDADGNRTTIGYPSGRVVGYTFDLADRPIAASSVGDSYVSSASYLPFGPLGAITYGNGTVKTMLYDSRYRPSENKLTSATAVLADYLYHEDGSGNITQIHDATNAAYNRDFSYDDLNRLTTANSGAALWGAGSYQYDAMGNMTSLHLGSRSLSFAYVGSTPKLQSVSGWNSASVAYDSAGNDVTNGSYSARNLFQRYGQQSPWTTWADFSYDGRGVRIVSSQTTPGPPPRFGTKTRRSIYSPELHLLAQSDWASFIAEGVFNGTDYIWFGDQPVAQAFTDPTLPTRYTFTDHLGTPILQTAAGATVIWRAEYEPYGGIFTYRVGDDSDSQALRLPGQEASDTLAGQEYNIFRWYRAEWGRYTQADPIGVAFSDINGFRYAGGNPLLYLDPSGLVTTRQTYTKRGTLTMPGDGFYSLRFGKAFATGECSGCGGHWRFKLTLNFDHGYYCTTANSCRIELWHANIASAFIASAAQYWNQYEKVEFIDKASCKAAANYYANDLARNITNPNNWPDKLLTDYNKAQNDYEETHHGWTCSFFSGSCGAY